LDWVNAPLAGLDARLELPDHIMKRSLARRIVVLVAVVLLAASVSAEQMLHFSLSGTLDTPNRPYPLLGSDFDAAFDLSSDPRDLLFPNDVSVYAAATYSNAGITVFDPHALIEFRSASDGGGIYIFFEPTNWFPNGFTLEIYNGAPVLYSGTAAEPHFDVGTGDLRAARLRIATHGAGQAGSSYSWISSPALTITTVPEPGPLAFGILAIAVVSGRRVLNARPEWRGTEGVTMQTGAANPRPLQADG
jgi:hypothetical protein